MIIEEITESEFLEVLDLHRKGWTQCTEMEQRRWARLLAKAKLAHSRRDVLSEILMKKFIKEQDND